MLLNTLYYVLHVHKCTVVHSFCQYSSRYTEWDEWKCILNAFFFLDKNFKIKFNWKLKSSPQATKSICVRIIFDIVILARNGHRNKIQKSLSQQIDQYAGHAFICLLYLLQNNNGKKSYKKHHYSFDKYVVHA